LQDNVDTKIIETWIAHMKELESIWNTKIQELSQKRKHDSDDKLEEVSSSKATAKKRKALGSVRA
jgi:hypothetical protein